MATPRMDLGRRGEDVAARFLTGRGGVLVARNLRVGHDEIDLLVSFAGERVAVEVKTAGGDATRPEEGFDTAKARSVRRAAHHLTPPVWRIDLVTVSFTRAGATVRWIPDAG